MQIVLADESSAPSLSGADDFTGFSVSAPGGSADLLDTRLGTLGSFDGDHAWINVDQLAELVGAHATDPAWQDGLNAMVGYAKGHGFASDDGSALRAHIEWVD